ncbi:MAG TPA: ATP-binding protein [Longimicrobiaceae bacterium]|nr:ATP-binding protein [Longimicrobiaceae bacterium]
MSLEESSRGSNSKQAARLEIALELPSDLRLIEAVVSYLVGRCRASSFEGPRLDLNFRVGVTEALANAVLYGNENDPDKTIRVEFALDALRVEVRVIDEGPGFDPAAVPDPTTPERLESPSGRGIFLIRNLMDELEFNEAGNALRMVLDRQVATTRAGSAP